MSRGDGLGRVVSINVSAGGVPKTPVDRCRVSVEGLHGDRQRHRKIHGGPLRAVCLYSADHIAALREEGHPIAAGSTGENLTIAGLDWAQLVPGVRLRVGEVELELTAYANPCHQIAGSFRDADSTRIAQKLHPGWSRLYAKVVKEGAVAVSDPVTIVRSRD
jgi:MOSC domain-containing protein YiiM